MEANKAPRGAGESLREAWTRLPPLAQISMQFAFELSLPAAIALAVMWWKREYSLASFMATYTAIGVAAAILLRIIKQHRQDRGFQAMRTMLGKIEAASADLIGHATGGDTAPVLGLSTSADGITIGIEARGKFPLLDVRGTISEVTEYSDNGWREENITYFGPFEFLPARQATPDELFINQGSRRVMGNFPRSGAREQRFHVSGQARNGRFRARIVCRWNDDGAPAFVSAMSTVAKGEQYSVWGPFPGAEKGIDPEEAIGFGRPG